MVGSANIYVFVVGRAENRQKNDNWNFWIWGFFVQKWPFRDAYLFSKNALLNPYFYSVFWVCAFLAKLSKRGILDTRQKQKKN